MSLFVRYCISPAPSFISTSHATISGSLNSTSQKRKTTTVIATDVPDRMTAWTRLHWFWTPAARRPNVPSLTVARQPQDITDHYARRQRCFSVFSKWFCVALSRHTLGWHSVSAFNVTEWPTDRMADKTDRQTHKCTHERARALTQIHAHFRNAMYTSK